MKTWDNEEIGLIDALELFAGLVLFADFITQEKIRFLFNILDFKGICL